MSDAYKDKKWAFVSDVARLLVLYNYGGIYLDTDVGLLQPIKESLLEKTFFVFENGRSINTGLCVGAEKHDSVIEALLSNYRVAKYDSNHYIVNTHMDRAVFLKLFPEIIWDNTD